MWPGEAEPVYQGKKLSEWVRQYDFARLSDRAKSPEYREATNAICQIGTNAVPFLLKWTDYELPAWRTKVGSILDKFPDFIGQSRALAPLRGTTPVHLRASACYGFEVLGSTAKGAVPELTRIMETRATASGRYAAASLAYMGPDGLPPLLATFTNTHFARRSQVLSRFVTACAGKTRKTDLAAAVPVLVQCLADSDPMVAGNAALALGELRIEEAIAVPALTNSLADPRAQVREASANALFFFGPAAKPAAPALASALNDPDPAVKKAASSALEEIEPKPLKTNSLPKDWETLKP
jgi:hypothetical protein